MGIMTSPQRNAKYGVYYFRMAVPKKLVPLAVKRNLIKRRIKGQIRLLPSALLEKKDGFLFVLFHGKKEVSSKEISECLNNLILKTFH
jgi:ribonuclease P protein component